MDISLVKGELVAIPAYFEDQKYPGRVILAVVDEQMTNNKFKARHCDLVVMDPFDLKSEFNLLVPLVRRDLGVDSYFTSRSGIGYEVWIVSNYSRGEVYCGFEAIINFLSCFPEFKPHIASLNAVHELLQEKARQEALDASMRSAAI